MVQRIKRSLILQATGLFVLLSLVVPTFSMTASADCSDPSQPAVPGHLCVSPLPHVSGDSPHIQTILSIVFGILAAVSLVFITVGGLRYVLSAGDANKISQAKNTIIYAVVGLVVAIAAQAIITFVIGNI